MRPAIALVALLCACGDNSAPSEPPREACVDRQPVRRPLYGDLHVHTRNSFDAAAYRNVLTPADAYRFARGEPVGLPPLDADGVGTRTARLRRPLDFAAVTDHGEFIGEIALCTTPGSPSYDSETCRTYRDPDDNGAVQFGFRLSLPALPRYADVCGPGDRLCLEAATARWAEIRAAAEDAYDRSSACEFTSFAAYEYTNTLGVSNLHRNVVFASSIVPERPISLYEAPTPIDLWRELDTQCVEGLAGCDVIVLPHNSNLSNGQLFTPDYAGAIGDAEQREVAELRARMEPVVEIFQHKGDSECRSGFVSDNHDPDPFCEFEKQRAPGWEDCLGVPGSGGMRLMGCLHHLDFVRNVLKEGLREEARLGVNPYRLGFIGSTDTHNATPGLVESVDFPGHIGVVDDTADERLGEGNATHDGIINNPGGLAAVWAEENSREAIIAALRRRETFATSGPRIAVRFFAGWDLSDAACGATSAETAAVGYQRGVSMGGVLDGGGGRTLTLVVHAENDELPIERVQIVKGWIEADGSVREQVIDALVASPAETPAVNLDSCEASGDGLVDPCVVYRDAEHDPATRTFYYARVIENPTCRWSRRQCNEIEVGERPALCADGTVPDVVQQRAWSSPIWID